MYLCPTLFPKNYSITGNAAEHWNPNYSRPMIAFVFFALSALDQIIQQYGFNRVCAVVAITIKNSAPEQYSQRVQQWADSIPSLPFSMEDQKSLCVYASNYALERVAHYLSLVANAIA